MKRLWQWFHLDDTTAIQVQKRIAAYISSKLLISLASVGIAIITLCSTTFAWYVSEDVQTNPFQGGSVIVRIQEEFKPIDNWKPGQRVEKEVTFINKGTVPAVMRVSLEEYLSLFEIDLPTGNLMLQKKGESDTIAQKKDATTWLEGALWPAYFYDAKMKTKVERTQDGLPLYHKITALFHKAGVHQGETGQNSEIKKYLSIEWDESVTKAGAKWIYYDATDDGADNGYFYYTEIVRPSERTLPLIDGVAVSNSLPNTYKNAPYQLNILVEGVNANQGVLESMWELHPGNPIYDALNPFLLSNYR